jgi:hypothetical protein
VWHHPGVARAVSSEAQVAILRRARLDDFDAA